MFMGTGLEQRGKIFIEVFTLENEEVNNKKMFSSSDW